MVNKDIFLYLFAKDEKRLFFFLMNSRINCGTSILDQERIIGFIPPWTEQIVRTNYIQITREQAVKNCGPWDQENNCELGGDGPIWQHEPYHQPGFLPGSNNFSRSQHKDKEPKQSPAILLNGQDNNQHWGWPSWMYSARQFLRVTDKTVGTNKLILKFVSKELDYPEQSWQRRSCWKTHITYFQTLL